MKGWHVLALVLPLLAGCERMMHDMYDQPRGKAYGSSPLFGDGSGSRTPPAGTVVHARGALAGSSSGRLGMERAQARRRDEVAQAQPYPVDAALLARGQGRFRIHCLPCHSPLGDGDGRVVRRGFPAPPSYHSDRLRAAPDRYLFDVITRGYGVMAPYADRVTPADRWAIVAYIRALQLSQHARVDRLPMENAERVRQALAAAPAPRQSSMGSVPGGSTSGASRAETGGKP